MPAKNCIGREQSADLFESLATEILALNCQSASLVVVEQDAFRAVRFPKFGFCTFGTVFSGRSVLRCKGCKVGEQVDGILPHSALRLHW
jgi:hypothetical protein